MMNQSHSEQITRPQWKSRVGFILAAIGSAVGLGNIWRFSYLCYENGGGAFLVPYFIALCVVGIPLMILELGVGHRMRGSAPLSFARISRRWEWLGWWAVLIVMYGIMLYYSSVIAWCLNYVFFSFHLSWGADPNDFFFNTFLKLSDGPMDIGGFRPPILFSLAMIWGMCWMIVYFGIQKGVERANKIFMPMLFALISILVVWSVNLEGAREGLAVYLKPDFSRITDKKIWIDAFSQIFFTLSLGFGIMIAYASYLPKKTALVKDALIISLSNCLFSVFAGFAVFGTLGYMAHATNVPVSEVVSKSIGLAFVSYPQAISLMPGLASLFGVLFFTSLVIAGLSSGISILEAFASALMDKFQFSRGTVVTVLAVTGFAGSVIFTAESGLHWLDIADHFITHYGLVLVGLFECILVAWVYKASTLRQHVNHVAPPALSRLWDVCVRYCTPAVLIFLMIHDFTTEFQKVPGKEGYTFYGGYDGTAVLLIGPLWLVIALIGALFISNYPWKHKLKDLTHKGDYD